MSNGYTVVCLKCLCTDDVIRDTIRMTILEPTGGITAFVQLCFNSINIIMWNLELLLFTLKGSQELRLVKYLSQCSRFVFLVFRRFIVLNAMNRTCIALWSAVSYWPLHLYWLSVWKCGGNLDLMKNAQTTIRLTLLISYLHVPVKWCTTFIREHNCEIYHTMRSWLVIRKICSITNTRKSLYFGRSVKQRISTQRNWKSVHRL